MPSNSLLALQAECDDWGVQVARGKQSGRLAEGGSQEERFLREMAPYHDQLGTKETVAWGRCGFTLCFACHAGASRSTPKVVLRYLRSQRRPLLPQRRALLRCRQTQAQLYPVAIPAMPDLNPHSIPVGAPHVEPHTPTGTLSTRVVPPLPRQGAGLDTFNLAHMRGRESLPGGHSLDAQLVARASAAAPGSLPSGFVPLQPVSTTEVCLPPC